MPFDPVAHGIQHRRFEQRVAAELHPRMHQPRLQPLHVRNGAEALVTYLALTAALNVARVPRDHRDAAPVANARTASTAESAPVARQPPMVSHAHAGPALLPGAYAGSEHPYQQLSIPIDEGVPHLTSIANGALTSCVVHPQSCPRTLLIAGGLTLTSAASFLAGRLTASSVSEPQVVAGPPVLPSSMPVAAPALPDTLLALLPAHEQHALLEIIRDCGADPACMHPAVRTLVERQPEEVRHQIMGLAAHAVPAAAGTASGWPPAAHAAVLPPGEHWLDWAATLLEGVVPLEQARLQLDIEDIVRATAEAMSGFPEGPEREAAANAARRDMVQAMLERDGHQVQVRPFAITTRNAQGARQRFEGRNLHVSFGDDRPEARTLMVMAHADVTGTDLGSVGTIDNGSGLGVLLYVARELRASPLPAGTRVELLLTDLEERGLIGVQAYLRECRAQANCPDMAVNADMLGRGDSLAISGSDQQGLYRIGDASDTPARSLPVTAEEAHFARQLQQSAAEVGLAVHDSHGWTMQSDHLVFQGAGVPALGVTLIDAVSLGQERNLQQARARSMAASANVQWHRLQDYIEGRLSASERATMDRQIDDYDAAFEAFRALPRSDYSANIHNGHDQLDRLQPRQALRAAEALTRAAREWLEHPAVVAANG